MKNFIQQFLESRQIHPVEFELSQFRQVLHGLSAGQLPGNTPTVFLHGWLDNCFSFLPLLTHMKTRPYFAIDLPGHGRSPLRSSGITHFQDYLYCLFDLFQTHSFGKVNLVGHSMGGAIASLFAGTFPEMVDRLVLIEAIGPMSGPESEAPKRLGHAIRTWAKGLRLKNPSYLSLAHGAEIRAKGGLNLQNARLLVERGMIACEDGWRWDYHPSLKLPSPLNFSESQVHSFLASIACPTLFIRAKGGVLDRSPLTASRVSQIAKIKELTLDGGHHIHMEAPHRVAREIESFLN